MQNFLIVFGSLLVEAMPFILLGAFVSAAIEVFVPASAFAQIARLPRRSAAPGGRARGDRVPGVRMRLGAGGPAAGRERAGTVSAAVTFMLAAPIVNPVVVASTFVAYRGRDTLWVMVLGRMALGFLVAVAVGWVVGRRAKETSC